MQEKFSRYERSRILGARALQIAMNAPVLIKVDKEELEKIHFDPLKIAIMEFEAGVLPISVTRPLPQKKEDQLKKIVEKKSDKEIENRESSEEEEIAKSGDIMKIAEPEEESEKEDDKE